MKNKVWKNFLILIKNKGSEKMNWYLQSSNNSDIAISTRIRLARNLNDFKFNLNKEELQQLEKFIQDNLYQIGYVQILF